SRPSRASEYRAGSDPAGTMRTPPAPKRHRMHRAPRSLRGAAAFPAPLARMTRRPQSKFFPARFALDVWGFAAYPIRLNGASGFHAFGTHVQPPFGWGFAADGKLPGGGYAVWDERGREAVACGIQRYREGYARRSVAWATARGASAGRNIWPGLSMPRGSSSAGAQYSPDIH